MLLLKRFFVWGFAMDWVQTNKVYTWKKLRERSEKLFMKLISVSVLKRCWADQEHRLDYLKVNNGIHIQIRYWERNT